MLLIKMIFCSYHIILSSEREILYNQGLQKRGEVWCGGARETREPRVTIG